MPNVLITGGSGYLGGSLLAHLESARDSLPDGLIYALVRSEEQANLVESHYAAIPLTMDLSDEAAITETLLKHQISIVYFLIDAINSDTQLRIITGLAKFQERTGVQTHFLHTSGAKIFSSHAGFATESPTTDNDAKIFQTAKSSKSKHALIQHAAETNITIVENAEAYGVRAYIFIPCIVYGEGKGFGNKISIQTVAIVRAAKATRHVYRIDQGKPVWPVSHIDDTTGLYLALLRKIMAGDTIGHNLEGFYLASSGVVSWDDIYSVTAKALIRRGVVDSDEVHDVDDRALQRMAEALGCGKEFVAVSLGGLCTLKASRGKSIDWRSRYRANHILEAMDTEIDLILRHI